MDNSYTVKDFIKEVFNIFIPQNKKNPRYKNYVLIVRLLILAKIVLLLSIFMYGWKRNQNPIWLDYLLCEKTLFNDGCPRKNTFRFRVH